MSIARRRLWRGGPFHNEPLSHPMGQCYFGICAWHCPAHMTMWALSGMEEVMQELSRIWLHSSMHPHFPATRWVSGLPGGLAALYSTEAVLAYLAWFFGLVALHLVLPGRTAEGTVLPDGSRLKYKLNGELL